MKQDIKCHICNEVILGSVELKQGETYLGDSHYGMVCSNHTDSFERLKEIKLSEIDSKTQELISRGFTFDERAFSLSDNAQRNWIGIAAGIASGLYTEANFPFPLSDIQNAQYDLTWENAISFLDTVKNAIGNAKVSGTILKQSVLDASDQQELDLVIDNR